MKQALICCAIAFVITAAIGPSVIRYLRKMKFGQKILEIGPKWHMNKQNIPTMGGFMFIIGIGVAILAAGWPEMLEGRFTHLYVYAFALVFGVIGYILKLYKYNVVPIVLGLILGPIGERGLRRSLLLSDGDPSILFSTSLCWILIALCVLGVLSPLLMERMERRMRESAES